MVNVEKSTGYIAKVEDFTYNGKLCKAFHCQVDNWSVSQYKQMLKDWEEFRNLVDYKIYAFPPNNKVAKFAEKFGFKYVRHVKVGQDSKDMPMYIHEV